MRLGMKAISVVGEKSRSLQMRLAFQIRKVCPVIQLEVPSNLSVRIVDNTRGHLYLVACPNIAVACGTMRGS